MTVLPGVSSLAKAQTGNALDSILDEIASGRKVSVKASLPLQVGFFDGATALYIELAPRVARSIASVRLTCLDSWGGR